MSKIEELIKTLCPQGVEYKAINQLFNMNNGYTPSKSNTEYWNNGSIPWFRLDDIRKNGRILSHSLQYITPRAIKNNKLFSTNSIIISKKATIGEHALITTPFVANDQFTILTLKDDYNKLLNIKYIYYYFFIISKLCINNTNTGSLSSVNMSIFKQFQIPIPPMEVQEEIVKVLDAFTNLEAQLKAELAARKKQYTYYRNALLSFKPDELENNPLKKLIQTLCPQGVEYKQLGEYLAYEQPNKYIVQSTNYHNDYEIPVLTAGDSFILGYTNEINGIYQASKAKPVIIFDDFTTSLHWVDFKFKVKSSAMKLLQPKNNIISFKYMYYIMKNIKYTPSEHSRQWISKYSKFQISIPPIEVQEEIVRILDNFDALTNDISAGLPAEINARRQQYEYFRNKLLTFKEKNVSDINISGLESNE